MSAVPLVGQPATLLFWYPTTLLRCRCDPSETVFTLLVITGIQNAVECPKCHKLYMVNQMQVEPNTMMVQPVVQVAIPAKSKEVM